MKLAKVALKAGFRLIRQFMEVIATQENADYLEFRFVKGEINE